MGYRLYVNNDICYGKLYGYTDDERPLRSLHFLVDRGYIKDDEPEENVITEYKDALFMFDCSYPFEFDMLYNDFLKFHLLYLCDMIEKWENLNYSDFKDDVIEWNELIEKIPCESAVHLEWW